MSMPIKVFCTNERGQLPIGANTMTPCDNRFELYVDYEFDMGVIPSQGTKVVPISLRFAFPEGTYGRITSIVGQRDELTVDIGGFDDEGRIYLKLKNSGVEKRIADVCENPVAHLVVEQVRTVEMAQVHVAEELK